MEMGWKWHPLNVAKQVSRWVQRQPVKNKALLAMAATLACFALIYLFVVNWSVFLALSEITHVLGIIILAKKLLLHNNCSGLSLKSQELTAMYLFVRMCSKTFAVFDFAKFISTIWVIYMMKFWPQSSYVEALDNYSLFSAVVPAAVLSLVFHPIDPPRPIFRILSAFSVYVESVAVLPQLRLMQHAKVVEPFTAHYVFALGVSRFLSCASCIIKVTKNKQGYFVSFKILYMWPFVCLITEAVNTFILADFCYYYVKSVMEGQLRMTLPGSSKNSKPS